MMHGAEPQVQYSDGIVHFHRPKRQEGKVFSSRHTHFCAFETHVSKREYTQALLLLGRMQKDGRRKVLSWIRRSGEVRGGFDWLIFLGNCHMLLHEGQIAFNRYRGALAIAGNNRQRQQANYRCGMSLLRIGLPDDALRHATTAVGLETVSCAARYLRSQAVLMSKEGNPAQVIEDWHEVARLPERPVSDSAWRLLLVKAYIALHQKGDAIRQMNMIRQSELTLQQQLEADELLTRLTGEASKVHATLLEKACEQLLEN